jgi:hypothetical protein
MLQVSLSSVNLRLKSVVLNRILNGDHFRICSVWNYVKTDEGKVEPVMLFD